MIAQLTGKIITKSPQHTIVDVNGVGYEVVTSLNSFYALPEVGETVQLHIHTHVREDQLSLFGFMDLEEKKLFKKLTGVSGIGPKLAIAILSGLSTNDLIDSILSQNIAKLNAIPGIGRKTAERLIIELKDTLAKQHSKDGAILHTGSIKNYEDAISALINLGYKRVDAEKALAKIAVSNNTSLNNIIRSALKELSPAN